MNNNIVQALRKYINDYTTVYSFNSLVIKAAMQYLGTSVFTSFNDLIKRVANTYGNNSIVSLNSAVMAALRQYTNTAGGALNDLLNSAAVKYNNSAVFNFKTSNPTITYTRTGQATAKGTTTVFAADVPQRVVGSGLLLEPASTNRIVNNQQTDMGFGTDGLAIWTAAPGVLGPTGLPMSKLAVAGGGAYAYIGLPVTVGVPETFSIFVRQGDSANPNVVIEIGGPGGPGGCSVNTITGVVSSSTATAVQTVNYGSGVWRIELVWTPAATGTSQPSLILPGAADGTGHYFTCAQVETRFGATSYIPTNAGTATRGLPTSTLPVPSNNTTFKARYNGNLLATGPATPSSNFDMVNGRPWVGTFLEELTFEP